MNYVRHEAVGSTSISLEGDQGPLAASASQSSANLMHSWWLRTRMPWSARTASVDAIAYDCVVTIPFFKKLLRFPEKLRLVDNRTKMLRNGSDSTNEQPITNYLASHKMREINKQSSYHQCPSLNISMSHRYLPPLTEMIAQTHMVNCPQFLRH
jgi:hypothetical protein